MALTVNVQVGSWHDDPVKYAGRAHLWEHTIFLGSKKHPGHHEFDELTAKVGGMHNAYTANDRTFYYFNQHPSSLPLSVSLLGGMISEPIWNNDAFLKEKENVKNEALDYQNRDNHAVVDMPFLHLSPKGHPLAMYQVGTQAQLSAMTLEDLRSLYQSYYRPEYMQIIIAGNFDASAPEDDRLDEKKLIQLLEQNFELSSLKSKPTEFKKNLPSIYPEDLNSPRMIEIETQSDQKILNLYFQADEIAHQNPFFVETLLDSLNLNTPGSLTRLLKDRGLVTGGGFGFQRINNQTHVYAQFNLTEVGAKQRALVVSLIFEVTGKLQREGLSEEIFSYLKQRNILGYQEMLQTPYRAAEHFARFLDLPFSSDIAFDFETQYGRLETKDISKMAAALFSPDRMIGAYIGNEIKGSEKCSIFGRSFNKLAPRENLQMWKAAYSGETSHLKPNEADIVLRKIPLTFSEERRGKGERPSAQPKSKVVQTKLYIQEDHSLTQAAIRAELYLPAVDGKESLARQMLISAFRERFSSEISYLDSLNLFRDISATPYKIEISVKGNSQASQQALRWLFDQLLEFSPESEELERARQKIIAALLSSLDGFTAHTATRAASAVLSNIGQLTQEKLKLANKLKSKEAMRLTKNIFARTDIILAGAGDVLTKDLEAIAPYIRKRIPKVLKASERKAYENWSLPIRSTVCLYAPLGDSKAPDAFAHVRVFEGPEIGSSDTFLFSTFANAFGNAVYRLNRSERNLGYVHNAYATLGDKNFRLMLVGQTDGAKNFPRIAEGWNELLNQVMDASFPTRFLQDTIDGNRLTLKLKPSTQAEVVDLLLLYGRDYKRLDYRQRQLATLARAKPQDLLKVAKKYLKARPYLDVVAAKKPYKGALTSLASARKKLTTRRSKK